MINSYYIQNRHKKSTNIDKTQDEKKAAVIKRNA